MPHFLVCLFLGAFILLFVLIVLTFVSHTPFLFFFKLIFLQTYPFLVALLFIVDFPKLFAVFLDIFEKLRYNFVDFWFLRHIFAHELFEVTFHM